MENFALSMREVADKYNADKEEKREQAHKDYIENYMLPNIEYMAARGLYHDKFSIPTNLSAKRMARLLSSIGFACEVHSESYLTVKW